MHGVRHGAVIGPAPIRRGERPLKDLQLTLRAPRPVEVDRTTAVAVGQLALPTHSRLSRFCKAARRLSPGSAVPHRRSCRSQSPEAG
jgi:hypothetical protein